MVADHLLVAAGSIGIGGGFGAGGAGGAGGQVIATSNDPIVPGAYAVVIGTTTGAASTFRGLTASGGTLAGGAGGVSGANGSNGSNGTTSSINGSSTVYGSSGGGGAGADPVGTLGGNAGNGGGNGGPDLGGNPQSGGDATTHGSGGGGAAEGAPNPGNHMPGILIVRYFAATPKATGGTITSGGGYQIHTFTASGTFTVLPDPSQMFQVF